MKKLLTLALSAVLCTAAVVVAQDSMKKDDMKKDSGMKSEKTMMASGTVTKIDKDGKMMMMKDKAGKEMTMYWDDSTKVKGEMMEGHMATVHYMMSGDKMMAHTVTMHAGMKKSDMKEEKK